MIADLMLKELDQEARSTRKLLERVPDGQLEWRPHPRSMSLGQLALHVAVVPGAIADMAANSPFQAPRFNHATAQQAAQLVPALDSSLTRARAILTGKDDGWMKETWRMIDGDRELWVTSRVALLRTLMLNHWYHHRGQLSVYLRQLGVTLPSIYGPSADEDPFADAS
jgi:uncharacterized damage-inducible protein DinB